MENKIVTGEEFLNSKGITGIQANTISNWMVEFAKLHVEMALKEAAEIVDMEVEKDFLTKDVILNSYSLTNIK